MMNVPNQRFSILPMATLLLISSPALAQGKGDGGIVIKDEVPVYSGSKNQKVVFTLKRGAAIAGVTTIGLSWNYHFEEEDGRTHIVFYKEDNTSGALYWQGWINPSDIARFTYDCGCDRDSERARECRPFSKRGWGISTVWNTCFKESRDAKLAELKAKLEQGPTATTSAPAASTEKSLTNDDVLSLIKVGLGDDLIISKIQQAPRETLDVSTDALIKLKTQGASKVVIEAIMKRVSKRK